VRLLCVAVRRGGQCAFCFSDGHEQVHEGAHARALAVAVDALRQQLEIATRQTEAERSRVDQLLIELADVRTAAMISGSEAAAIAYHA